VALCAAAADGTVKENNIPRDARREVWTFPLRPGAESGAMAHHEPDIALSEPSADEIKTTTCYMCACRCASGSI